MSDVAAARGSPARKHALDDPIGAPGQTSSIGFDRSVRGGVPPAERVSASSRCALFRGDEPRSESGARSAASDDVASRAERSSQRVGAVGALIGAVGRVPRATRASTNSPAASFRVDASRGADRTHDSLRPTMSRARAERRSQRAGAVGRTAVDQGWGGRQQDAGYVPKYIL